jgi:NADH-quinone oxidoreductase subunit K
MRRLGDSAFGIRTWFDPRVSDFGFLTMDVGLNHYLFVSATLFALGLLGVLLRRNLLIIYMGLEMMLNAGNLALVAFSRYNNNLDGQIMVFFIITVAAAEVAVGLALIVALYRKRQTAHTEDLTQLKF